MIWPFFGRKQHETRQEPTFSPENQAVSAVQAVPAVQNQAENADSALVKSGDPQVLEVFGLGAMAAGVAVNERTAMQLSAVNACVRLVSNSMAMLPLHLYKDNDGERERVRGLPVGKLLNLRPNPRFSASAFKKFCCKSNLLRGDAFAVIVRNRMGEPVAFQPYAPCDVVVEKDGTRLVYFFREEGRYFARQQEDVLHVSGLGFDGVRSESVITHYARRAVGGALAADKYAEEFYSSGTMQKFAILKERAMNADDIQSFRDQWVDTYGGRTNANKPLVLTGGASIQELSLNAHDAQLLEARNFSVPDICRFFGVPPHMIGHAQDSTWGSGIEQLSIAYVQYCLQPYLVDFEQELNYKLFPEGDYFFEFETKGLLQGDSKAQAEYFRAALGGSSGPGWMTSDEVRKLVNLGALGGMAGELVSVWSGGAAKGAAAE
jgi:HK97 family phage portal protein